METQVKVKKKALIPPPPDCILGNTHTHAHTEKKTPKTLVEMYPQKFSTLLILDVIIKFEFLRNFFSWNQSILLSYKSPLPTCFVKMCACVC